MITTRRPNYGVGALRDREAGQQARYLRALDEHRLFTPLQRLTNLSPSASNTDTDKDIKAGLFYRQLGEDCARFRVCVDIVVTSSPLSPSLPSLGLELKRPNTREFLDVATLAEFCRVTCGRFKWLRVGNECGIVVGENTDQGASFTAEQLREELK